MKLGFVGLGKMGLFMVERLSKRGHNVIAFDITERARKAARKSGAQTVISLDGLADKLRSPRVIWVMVPSGDPTEKVIKSLSTVLKKGDIIVDGGNSYYKDSIKRGTLLRKKGINLIDAGTSGGIWGLKEGYCLMAGGEKAAFNKVKPIFKALAPRDGYAYMGKSGSGHFVKMIHNGIEYAMLEAYAEGFEVMKAKREFKLDLGAISHLWNHGSVIRSWLLELAENVFKKNSGFENIKAFVADSGEGRWTIAEAISENVPTPVIALALLQRLRSRQKESFSAKVIAALRNEFGGHAVKKKI